MLNQKNFDYLKRQLLFTGFGDALNDQLEKKLAQGNDQFTLEHAQKFGKDEVTATLHFAKGAKSDNYFFNTYDLVLKQPEKEDVKQIVFIGEKYNYSLKERYNMLDGRAVYKDQPVLTKDESSGRMVPTGTTYKAWKDLDLKNTDKLGNFAPKTMYWDHQKELHQYPIKQLKSTYDSSRLLASLEKGNKAKVTVLKDGQEAEGFVIANPRQMRLDFYDKDGQRISVSKVEKLKQDQSQKVETRPGETVSQENQQRQKRQNRQSNRQRTHVS